MSQMLYTDEFGYLPTEQKIEWPGGAIEPSPLLAETIAWMEAHGNRDGYVYPPTVHTRTLHLDGSSTVVPNSDRPALLHRLPATHMLRLETRGDEQNFRSGLAGFVIHFTGFLYGHRCQFFDWWVDGRVPLRGESDRSLIRSDDASLCLNRATTAWLQWSARERTLATNALFLHCRTPSYEWDWERFQAEYQILDAAFALAKGTLRQKHVTHSERIYALCNEFGLLIDRELIQTMVRLRNELIHEALWGGANPLEARGDYLAPRWMHKLTARLLLAILGIRGSYIGSAWWHFGRTFFVPE